MNQRLHHAAAALKTRGFDAAVFSSAEEAAAFILADLPAGCSVGIGGSMTVKDMGLADQLRASGRTVLWHWEAAPADRPAVLHQALNAEGYICSANALTDDGQIVQIDGTGNRVGALCYGPATVYLVVGRNKLVSGGVQQAIARIKQIACPMNARRLGLDTPCAKDGRCDISACQRSMCSVTAVFDRAPGGKTTKVLLVDEDLGY